MTVLLLAPSYLTHSQHDLLDLLEGVAQTDMSLAYPLQALQ